MILSSNPYQVTSAASQYQTTQAANKTAAASPATKMDEPEQAISASERKLNWDVFKEQVESDPSFAAEMAEAVSFIPDKMLVNLNEAPPLTDPAAFKKWASKSDEFDKEAAVVTERRIEIYNKMKNEGASDADIFNKILDFNRSLPLDYQVKAGMLAVDAYA
ncbi:hypothetical protein [Pseudoalteromonas luteoviolacea]|uniref:Uncharacterized protein n=1 Tax=Pseudoalteromonas luteoviolacea S4054 TaxID=1129367 RepID=A0A0F6ADE9_9GAMM|nr:hypothetical protein [Pseudoalteromonas luteoviolacea]AOT08279.1 hypothetical protein S4054249_10685 [Pseudoalteromonas luteoviolacea]AOT13195.1 hypothetical protein S40542_10660 [Pseudoalteromonas luteoviolacea]AOT18108.1 hypothetical protein S4054_10660 [Pseudoalteromonas luteoviolacea]KKE84215.1 hypothetical protein N479_09965 [Pseudoalteromonas luteoviolacea S4054]KZN76180.1 hypothetical protein N481_07450 [Pseudoalteromonas luteoviolacea S4047-1]